MVRSFKPWVIGHSHHRELNSQCTNRRGATFLEDLTGAFYFQVQNDDRPTRPNANDILHSIIDLKLSTPDA